MKKTRVEVLVSENPRAEHGIPFHHLTPKSVRFDTAPKPVADMLLAAAICSVISYLCAAQLRKSF